MECALSNVLSNVLQSTYHAALFHRNTLVIGQGIQKADIKHERNLPFKHLKGSIVHSAS